MLDSDRNHSPDGQVSRSSQIAAIPLRPVSPISERSLENTPVEACLSPTQEPSPVEIGLLTGGVDKPYAFGLGTALASNGVRLDFIGSDEIDSPELHMSANLNFLNLRGSQHPDAGLATKVWRVLAYYSRLIRYVTLARPKLFHILWNNRFQTIDRTLLMLYYKLLGKKIVFTAHNVNAGKRDGNDSLLNRLTLWMQYHLADHVFVHTQQMKCELSSDFGVREDAVTVIPFGINNSVPSTDLTRAEARGRLGIREREKVILFFGNIGPYKGLPFLAEAFHSIAATDASLRLIIAGRLGKGCENLLRQVRETLSSEVSRGQVIQKIEYIPDEDAELYLKSADLLVLPYTHVFQSGVLFLAYNFGLPVVATDVGSLREDIVEGETGFVCKPCDPSDLARAIRMYFESALYEHLDERRCRIRDHAHKQNSWSVVAEITRKTYGELLSERRTK